MKKRFIPVIPITVVLLLIGGLAYALDKKRQAKPEEQLLDTIHEEEALQAELLGATEEHHDKGPGIDTAGSKNKVAARSDESMHTLKPKQKKDKQPEE